MEYTIALITDFGTQDWYAPVMKSVIYSIYKKARIIDITHQIKPQNVAEAGFVLWNAHQWFAEPTVFVVVVDPGVGSSRDIFAVETEKHIIIAPDNGLLDLTISDNKIKKVAVLDNPDFYNRHVSNTFHGRDIFAPVAAHLASGVRLKEVGSKTELAKHESPFIMADDKGFYQGRVLYVDSFGNLITNFRTHHALLNGSIKINNFLIPQVSKTFSDVQPGEVVAYMGSSGLLEIAIRDGSASKQLRAEPLTKISLTID